MTSGGDWSEDDGSSASDAPRLCVDLNDERLDAFESESSVVGEMPGLRRRPTPFRPADRQRSVFVRLEGKLTFRIDSILCFI